MRIFIGLIEIANIAATYAKGFRALGHETFTVVLSKNPFYPDSQYDRVLDAQKGSAWLKRREFTLKAFLPVMTKCDVFVFFCGTAFLPRRLDYPILKLYGKRIVSVFLGSDIRYGYAFEQEMQLLGLNHEVQPFIDYIKSLPDVSFRNKLGTIRMAERFADLILSQPGHGQLQTKPYMRLNIPLDLSQFRFHVPDREVPVVLHVPSNPAIKGTDYVLAAIDQLKREGVPFEFRLVEKTPNARVRELLADADIVVDELFADTVATLSLEAMATGNVVLVRYLPDYARVPPGCPAVNVTKDTLTPKLRRVILNRELRRQLAYAGRPYVEAHHDHVEVAQQILDWLKPGGIREYDFIPTFYKNFVMPPQLLSEVHKKTRDGCNNRSS